MKYSRISIPRSFPLSASKHSQSLIVSKLTRRIGKSLRRFSLPSAFRALRISVLTHSQRAVWRAVWKRSAFAKKPPPNLVFRPS